MTARPRSFMALRYRYKSSDKAQRATCDVCGSRVAKDNVGAPVLLLQVGLFSHNADFKRRIIKNVMPDKAPSWYTVPAEEH